MLVSSNSYTSSKIPVSFSTSQSKHTFISVLRLDYSPAADRILGDDRGMYRALSRGDAEMAIDVWRGKVDNAVRHMSGLLARRRFDQELWDQLTRSLR